MPEGRVRRPGARGIFAGPVVFIGRGPAALIISICHLCDEIVKVGGKGEGVRLLRRLPPLVFPRDGLGGDYIEPRASVNIVTSGARGKLGGVEAGVAPGGVCVGGIATKAIS